VPLCRRALHEALLRQLPEGIPHRIQESLMKVWSTDGHAELSRQLVGHIED
jgi:hypothetical protein